MFCKLNKVLLGVALISGVMSGSCMTCDKTATCYADFFKSKIPVTTLIQSDTKCFEQATFNVLEALANPQFITKFGKTLAPSTAANLSAVLSQASSNFLLYALQQNTTLSSPEFAIYKFTVTPHKNLSLPEFASLYEDLLDKEELITPTIEDFYYEIKNINTSILPFERFVTLCATELKNISEGRSAATHDFLRRALDNLKEFSKNISLELMGTGGWEDDVVLEFQSFIDGRAKSIEQLLQQ